MSGIDGYDKQSMIAAYRETFLGSAHGLVVLQHMMQQLKMLPDQLLTTDEDVVLHNFGCQLSYYMALDWNYLARYIQSMPTESPDKEDKDG